MPAPATRSNVFAHARHQHRADADRRTMAAVARSSRRRNACALMRRGRGRSGSRAGLDPQLAAASWPAIPGARIGLHHAGCVCFQKEWSLDRRPEPGTRAQTATEQPLPGHDPARSETHTSELHSLMRISEAIFCLKKKKTDKTSENHTRIR